MPLQKNWKPSIVLARLHGMLVMGRRVRRLVSHVADLIPQGATVLDIGAGSGEIARAILDLRPDLEISGLDVLPRHDAAIAVQGFDGKQIPVGDSERDVCILVDVLHHCEDPPNLLREAARVAQSRVIVKDHIAEGRIDLAFLRFMDWFGNRGHGVRLTYNFLPWPRWQQMFEMAELTLSSFQGKLQLYPCPFNLLFERDLHFVACLTKSATKQGQP